MNFLKNTADLAVSVDDQIISEWWKGVSKNLPDFVTRLVICIVILIVGVKLTKAVVEKCRRKLEKRGVPVATTQILDALVKAVIYITIALIAAEIMNIPLNSVFYLLGTIAVALALAVKDFVATLASGIVILFLHPYVEGDYVLVSSGAEGTVSDISLFYTTLNTYDNKVIVVPNNQITSNALTNLSREKQRLVDIKVGISYDSDLKKAKEIFLDLISNIDLRIKEQPVSAAVSELGDSAVVLQGRFWVETADYWAAKWAVLEEIKLRYDAAGIQIPYPQVSVHMDETRPE